MTKTHKVTKSTFKIDNAEIDIKYWMDETSIHLAGFDKSGKQVTRLTYGAEVDLADNFLATQKETIIDTLVRTIEYDLTNNPELHRIN